MKKNIVVQEFNVEVEGRGFFSLQSKNGEVMVPTFGFDNEGKVLSRRIAEENGYASLKQEWVDKQIILASDNFRKEIHQEKHIDGQGHTFDQEEYHRDTIPGDVPVYAAIIHRSDAPNEIGIVVDSSPMFLENSSITVDKNQYKFSK